MTNIAYLVGFYREIEDTLRTIHAPLQEFDQRAAEQVRKDLEAVNTFRAHLPRGDEGVIITPMHAKQILVVLVRSMTAVRNSLRKMPQLPVGQDLLHSLDGTADLLNEAVSNLDKMIAGLAFENANPEKRVN